jgi:CubicO group peptidase (beta-lactamase class C family)
MLMSRSKCIFTILLLVSLHAHSQTAQPGRDSLDRIKSQLDQYLRSANASYHFNGAVLVAQKGQIILSKGYGYSNMTTKLPNTPDTRFPILSVGKTFTSTVILKLQEEGKLSVDDKLSKYFPDYPNGDKIKIEYLLDHTSGIHNYTDDVGIEDSAITNHPVSKQRVLDQFMNKPLEFKPGSRFSYNNSGYFLLGMIIEKITGKPYQSVVREMIFDPLGMNHSGFDYLGLPDSIKASCYQFWNDHETIPYHFYDSTYAYAAGSIYSTTTDLYKYAQAISSNQILSAESWKLAFSPVINHYGLGWMTGKFFEKNYVRHSGGYPGFMSEFIYYPEQEITIILLNNFGNYDQNVWATAMGISCIMLGLPYDDWKVREEIKVDNKILSQYEGKYETSNKEKMEIKLKGDHLYAFSSELPNGLMMIAESENSFYFQNFNTQLHFNKNSEGSIQSVTVHAHGRDYIYVKKK